MGFWWVMKVGDKLSRIYFKRRNIDSIFDVTKKVAFRARTSCRTSYSASSAFPQRNCVIIGKFSYAARHRQTENNFHAL